MSELRRALRPVRRRLRRTRLWRLAGFGLVLAAALTLAVVLFSFLLPIRDRALLCAAVAAASLLAALLAGLLMPVRDAAAARAADAHGLRERAQTALALGGDSPMTVLQREDAVAALRRFDCKVLRLPSIARPCLLAAAIFAAAAILFFVPNRQNDVVRRAVAFEEAMEQAAQQAQAEAEKPMADLSEKDRQELRRLMTDLSREIGEAREPMEAMLALGKAQERLEALRERMAGDAAEQLGSALDDSGLNALADALEGGDAQALEDALEAADADALAAAAGQLGGDMSSQLGAAVRALQGGDPSGAAGSLAGLQAMQQSAAASQLSGASQLITSLHANVAGQVSGQGGKFGAASQSGSGGGNGAGNQSGTGAGSGAGVGSTNEDAGAGGQEQSGRRGSGAPRYKEGEYESIYDPTRLDASQTEISAQGTQGEGDSAQAELGPGAGMLGDSVPYNEVVHDYAEAAARAADSQNLTSQERGWVNSYFSSLTE